MKKQLLLTITLAVFVAVPAFAQLAPPNSAGAAIAHIHLNANDVEVQKKFWTEVGGKIVNREKIVMAQFPGIYVLLRKQDYSGGSVGSVMNHFGFYVKDFDQAVARWKAAGLNWEPGNNPGQGYLNGPDGVRVEIYENKSISTPMQMHHIHLWVPDPIAAQKWYVQHFGATPGKRAQFDTANVPGTEITFNKVEMPQAPTKGRSVDHMGFEVRNIDAFVAKLQAAGIKTDAAIRNSANASGLRIVYITDPWGTEIELTEGLATPPVPVAGRWIDYPTPGTPRLPDGKANLSAPAPRTADGKPDLSGIWRASRSGDYGYDYNVALNLKTEDVRPWAEALRQERVQDFRKDSPLARCLPVSVPFLNFRGLSQVVQTPGLMVVLHESPNSPHRTIFMDGRQLPENISDLNPSWLGYSVGHWEQETLVVNSAGFNDLGWLDVGGHPQTESLRITERMHRRDFGHLEYEMTIDDPKVFTKPVTLRADKTLVPDSVLLEDVCENERSGTHLVSGVKVAPEILSRYAGTYEFAPGRQAVVTVSGEQVLVQDSAHPADRLFVARSETLFLSSVSMASVEFVKNAQGAVTHLVRTEGSKSERGARIR